MKNLAKISLLLAAVCLSNSLAVGQQRSNRKPRKAPARQASATEKRRTSLANDRILARAFANRTSNIQVEGEGTVTRLLSDDLNGARHQRFILQLASGQTLLVTHNIDIAPRIDELELGDSVSFHGEYVWNEKGGLIHWTHHDPQDSSAGGWIKHNGKTYQ